MSLFRCETTLFRILHTSHNTVNRVVQNSAQDYILEVLNDLAVASALREQSSERFRCSRIAKFLAVANLCRDQLAARGTLRLSALYEDRLRRFTSASFPRRCQVPKNDAFRLSTLQKVSLYGN